MPALKNAVLQPGDRFLGCVEAAKVLGTTSRTMDGWRFQGKGPRYYKHGKSVRYLLSDLTAWGKQRLVVPERKSA